MTLHPLASYPGPIHWTTSKVPHAFHIVNGTIASKVAELHQKYGPVVRIAPNELSYIRGDAWKDIYGLQPGRGELKKDVTIIAPVIDGKWGLFLAPSTNDHARMRRNLNPAFSDRALRDQEPRIMKYVELMIERLHDHCKDGPVDICSWYNFTTFDIIGELFFGESFDCLENSKYSDW